LEFALKSTLFTWHLTIAILIFRFRFHIAGLQNILKKNLAF